jgi:hypothetical protein
MIGTKSLLFLKQKRTDKKSNISNELPSNPTPTIIEFYHLSGAGLLLSLS